MNILFELRSPLPSCAVVGSSQGTLLSSLFSLSTQAERLLKEKSEQWHEDPSDKEVFKAFCCQDSEGLSVAVHLVDLVQTEFSEEEGLELGAKLFVWVSGLKEPEVCIDFSKHFSPGLLATVAAGFKIRSFNFDKYKTKKKKKSELQNVYFLSTHPDLTQKAFVDLNIMADCVNYCRSLSSEAPNVLDPELMAQEARTLKKIGVKVEILEERDMQKLGMNALLGVAQGSARPPFLAVCQWNGAPPFGDPIALVGKGVTFDSGGISLKPANAMHEMKEDMTGAAVVLASIKMAALLKLPLNIVGVVGLVENMPSGKAQRPSDIVISMSGKTIEVQNTDAEGRLVLADALFYTENEFSPRCIIDFATLTGAIQVALGKEFAGLFSDQDWLASRLIEAGESTKERLWRLPLSAAFEKDINSDVADVKNVGSGRGAGSITAAHFLKTFLVKGTPWAHIDIAAVTHDSKDRPLTGGGFTGFGVRLMLEFLRKILSSPLPQKAETMV
jgi:leucyl aminopeptidase